MSKINLSDGEWNIMKVLWHESPKTITQLTSELKESTGWSKNTIITMLNRLQAKGALRHEEGERARRYYPLVERAETALQETENFLEKVYAGSLQLMVNTLVEKNNLSREEINELYDILEKAEEKNDD